MRIPLLAKLTSLPAIAIGAALGMIVAGVLAVVGGSYAHSVVHDQLAPQKISFARPAAHPFHPTSSSTPESPCSTAGPPRSSRTSTSART